MRSHINYIPAIVFAKVRPSMHPAMVCWTNTFKSWVGGLFRLSNFTLKHFRRHYIASTFVFRQAVLQLSSFSLLLPSSLSKPNYHIISYFSHTSSIWAQSFWPPERGSLPTHKEVFFHQEERSIRGLKRRLGFSVPTKQFINSYLLSIHVWWRCIDGMFYASGRHEDNHLQTFHLDPHSNMNTGCQRLRFTFHHSLLIQTTCPLYCNVSSYTRSLLQRFRCLFSLSQTCCSLQMWRFFMWASHSSYQVWKLRNCPHLSSSARSSFTTLINRLGLEVDLAQAMEKSQGNESDRPEQEGGWSWC